MVTVTIRASSTPEVVPVIWTPTSALATLIMLFAATPIAPPISVISSVGGSGGGGGSCTIGISNGVKTNTGTGASVACVVTVSLVCMKLIGCTNPGSLKGGALDPVSSIPFS